MEQGGFFGAMELTFQREVFDERWLERRFVFESVRIRHRSTSKSSIAGVDPSNQSGLLFARTIKAEVRE
jgi:hypothetical protein